MDVNGRFTKLRSVQAAEFPTNFEAVFVLKNGVVDVFRINNHHLPHKKHSPVVFFFAWATGPSHALPLDPRHHRLSREKHTAAFNLAGNATRVHFFPNMLSSKMFRLRLFNMLL